MTLSAAQQDIRKQGIGSSDIAAVVGVNPYRTAMDVFMEKTGMVEPFAGNEATRWGERLEAVIAKVYKETLAEVDILSGSTMPAPPPDQWMIATPDYLVRPHASSSTDYILECKTAGARQAHRWSDPQEDPTGIPEEYVCQVAWQMAVTGHHSRCDVAVLIGGQDFRIYTINRDEELEKELYEAGKRFWFEHVLKNVPPAFDGSRSATEYLRAKYPRHTGKTLGASQEANRWAGELQIANRSLEKALDAKGMAIQMLCTIIGDADGIEGPGWRASWKLTKDRHYVDWESVARDLYAEVGQRVDPDTQLPDFAFYQSKHTRIEPGIRVFRPRFDKED